MKPGVIKQIGVAVVLLCLAACSISTQDIPTPPATYGDDRSKLGKTIALLGASGMVGGFVVREALSQGYDVRVLARTPSKLKALRERLTIIEGDAGNLASIEELLRGSDVVISALGPVSADGDAAKTVSTTATGHITRVMEQFGIQRYLVVSGAAVGMPGDRLDLRGWMIKKLAQIALSDTVRDKQSEYRTLVASPVQWTLVRCPIIEAKPYARGAVASTETPPSFRVRAGEVARFLIEQIDAREYVRQGPFLGSQ